MSQERVLYLMRDDPTLTLLYLNLPAIIQTKILVYYLSYGTVACHSIRNEIGYETCSDNELTIWRNHDAKEEDTCRIGGKRILRKSIGFTQIEVLYDMRMAITEYDQEANSYRIYLQKSIQKWKKRLLLELINNEPVSNSFPRNPRIFTNIFGFILEETYVDDDGLYDKMIVPKEQANFLVSLSFLSLVSGLYALKRGYYDLAMVPLGVFTTSIIYWTNPTYCWRRILDMVYVSSAMTYQMYRAQKAEYRMLYYGFLFSAVTFYPFSWYFHNNKYSSWKSVISHSLIHIVGNISNFVLYSGKI